MHVGVELVLGDFLEFVSSGDVLLIQVLIPP
jgi:hypothetical protein